MAEMEKFHRALLLLAALPLMSGAQEIIYARAGETVTLRLPEGFKPQKYYLYWYYNDVEVAWKNYMNGQDINKDEKWAGVSLSASSLIVKNIGEDQFGTYKCHERSNSATVSYRVLRLTVSVEPSLVLLGQAVTLHCDAENPSGLQKQVHWLNPQGEKIGGRTYKVNARRRDNGQWTCVVEFGKQTKEAQISVMVVYLDSPPVAYTSASSPLTIPCYVSADVQWERIRALGLRGGNWKFFPGSEPKEAQRLFTLSPEEASWKAEGKSELTPFKNRNLSLNKKLGRRGDRGDYVCTLEFDNGVTLNGTVRVEVLEITASPGTPLVVGHRFNLTCGLGVPLTPDLHLKWIPPERSYRQPPAPGRPLVIPAAAGSDSGRWRCELWRNDTPLMTAVIVLKIEPWLSAWVLVIICGGVAIVVLLSLILAFVLRRRRRARKSIHRRHQLCQCKNPKPKGFYRT